MMNCYKLNQPIWILVEQWLILPGILPPQVICLVFEGWHFVLLQHTEMNWLDISYSFKHGHPGDKHFGKFAM